MHRRIVTLALAVALLGLAGCTADGPTPSPTIPADAAGDEGQSVQDACAIVHQTITAATDEFEAADPKDPAALVAAMQSAAQTLVDSAGEVTNDEVSALLPDLHSMFVEVADVMQSIVEGDVSAIGDLGAVGDSFHETTQRFQDLCGS